MEIVLEEIESKTLGEISSFIQYGYTASATIENVGPKLLRITDIQDQQFPCRRRQVIRQFGVDRLLRHDSIQQ